MRLSEQATQEQSQAVERLVELTGEPEIAREWREGLLDACGTLAANPRRFAVLPRETRLMALAQVRRIVYRRAAHSVAYHAYYFVLDGPDVGDDGPMVVVFHIRHAARRPMTPQEARGLRQDLEP